MTKKIILAAVTAAFAFMAGCKTTQTKHIAKDEMELLRSPKEVIISGATGEIVGTEAHKKPNTVSCPDCGFPAGSLRERLIISEEVTFDDETMRRLKEKKDVVISGRTGEVEGSFQDKHPNNVKCPDCGFPAGSLRQRVIIMEEL
ncbi:MAG: hypothetical protein A2020_02015 [Lentisphaerae bacterium GWF2_45_14]|nr:MAG: hypothetical protein A2020_02015 [Lentisphaerae bacterium GWF2_45_14]